MAKKKSISVTFLTAECYPAAKVGGLADVMGSLPLYLDANVDVVMPRYDMPWFQKQTFETVFGGEINHPNSTHTFEVQKVQNDPLGFPLYVIHLPGLFDRDGVYADSSGHYFEDETLRYVTLQRAFLDWMLSKGDLPDIIHTHDHHTGLVPFMIQYCYKYESISHIATVFTIHNQRYQGAFGWELQYLLPEFDTWKSGLLDWDNRINPLASAVKCADRVTTVSPSYMDELKTNSFGLEWLFNHEAQKCVGILNGIDPNFWNPETDEFIDYPLKKSIKRYKAANKKQLLADTELDHKKPLISFIGRFAIEKGADLLNDVLEYTLSNTLDINFLILGSGNQEMEESIRSLSQRYPKNVLSYITYNEALAHRIYASSDFILMPSRVEPCGLNQMYAMRYGTIPMVNDIGGLHDSVKDDVTGIKFDSLEISELYSSLMRAKSIFDDNDRLLKMVESGMKEDFSWTKSATLYEKMYRKTIKEK